jgi:hypothetical protein
MAEKYLYFRTQPTDSSDDDQAQSACWPASSFMGMHPSSRTSLALFFKPIRRGAGQEGAADSVDNLDNNDSVNVTIPNDSHEIAMRAIANVMSGSNSLSFIVVANDRTDNTEYLAGSGITACGTIDVQASYTN